MITDQIKRHKVLLPINHKNYNFREKKNKIKGKFTLHVTLKLRLADLNYSFECDWLIELSDNKLSNNKRAGMFCRLKNGLLSLSEST